MDSLSTQLVLDKLTELIQAAGGLGEQVWPYLIRQALVEGWCMAGGFVFTLFGAIVFFILAMLDDFDSPAFVVPLVVFGLALVIMGVVFPCEGLPRILNPEYYAIRDLLYIVR